MNESRLIEREYSHFIDIYSGANETKLKIANDLFWKAAFLKVQLYALEDKIKKTGAVEYSNKGNSRVSLSYKTFNFNPERIVEALKLSLEENENANTRN